MPSRRGFTLVELIGVIAIAGIVLAMAAPRFFNANTYETRAQADAAAGFLRHAQKRALAMRRTVHVVIDEDADRLVLCLDAACTSPVPGPEGSAAYVFSADHGIQLSIGGGDLSFDAAGRPSGARVLDVTGDGTIGLRIEAETGYVYY